MNKIIFFIYLLFIIPLTNNAQSLYQICNELNLPLYNLNDKPDANLNLQAGISGKSAVIPITNENFDKVYLFFDELEECDRIVYSLKSKRFKRYHSELVEILRKNFGAETNIQVSEILGSTTNTYEKGDLIVEYEFEGEYPSPDLTFYLKNNIKLVESYDEFNKTTRIKPINFKKYIESNNNLEYGITFTGYLESQSLLMSIISDAKEWKFIKSVQVLLDNGDVTELELETKKEIENNLLLGVRTFEVGVTPLSKEQCESIIKSQTTKMRIKGDKRTGDIVLTKDVVNALEAVYKRIYNSN